MKGIQIIGIIVGIYLAARTYLNYKKGINNLKRTIFWLALWSTMIIVFIDPSLSELALPVLSTQDAMISAMILAILTVFVLIMHMWQHISKIEQMMVDLTQNIAVTEYMNELRQKAAGTDD